MVVTQFKSLVKESFLYPWVQTGREWFQSRRELDRWVDAGCEGAAPHRVKQGLVRSYARRYRCRVLVETGTYLGEMVHAMRHDFDRIFTIEVDEALAKMARRRFAGRANVCVLQGDSAVVIADVLRELREPALFWLDGHYSGGITGMGAKETPIVEEVEAIFAHAVKEHVLLIDDARCFGTLPDYPTLEAFREKVARERPDLVWELVHDIIRLTPRRDAVNDGPSARGW
jgi:hypothetical protein